MRLMGTGGTAFETEEIVMIQGDIFSLWGLYFLIFKQLSVLHKRLLVIINFMEY